MPKTTRSGTPKQDELPSTLQRSAKKAQRTFTKAYDAAAEQYGSAKRANQVAWAAVKHAYEKVGDHWEPKDEYGPSDAHAASENPRESSAPTAGGVDANATKKHLYELATRLGVEGRSRMTKSELVEALQKANDRASARARS
jgi:cation transport regulator ChaB